MPTHARRHARGLAQAATALFLAGCTPGSAGLIALPVTGPMAIAGAAKKARAERRAKPIRDVPPGASLTAPPDAALVVFIRPSARDPESTAILHDDQGRFVAEIPAASYAAVIIAADEYVIFPWSENATALPISLAEGKTYYVEVDASSGASATRAELLAVKPGSPRWAKVPEWLARAKHVAADRAAKQAYLDAHKSELPERMRRGLRVFDDYDRDQRDAHRLEYDDAK
jgi:hypothetical protein